MRHWVGFALALALVAGLVLGAIFFGGLWWTVRKGVLSKHPATCFLGSLLLRTGIILAGFYFVAGGHWQWLLACLLGFVIARLIVTRLTRGSVSPRRCIASLGETRLRDADTQEAGDAP